MNVKKIIISSTFGYGQVIYAYHEMLAITSKTIEYEYNPFL